MSIWMIFRTSNAPATGDGSGNGGSRIFLATCRNDLESAIRKRPLQRLGVIPRRAHPDIVLLCRRQNDRHGLRVHAPDFCVRFGGQESEDVGGDLALLGLPN